MEKYFKILEKMMLKAYKNNEVPVAALMVYNNKVISKGFNKRNLSNNVLDHAEIIAIKKANKRLKSWRLTDCDLYVTLEPCEMCKKIIEESRISNVYYMLKSKTNKTNKTNYIFLENDFSKMIKQNMMDFFKNKR